jgi:large subunit ribosomal protein L1
MLNKPSTKKTKRQKHYEAALKDVVQPSSAKEAIESLLKVIEGAKKYNETVECHMKLGIDVKHADQQVRSTVILPEGTGKTVKICVIAKGEKVKEALNAGADFAGSEELLDKIEKEGWLDFDVMIATPDIMGAVGKLGKVLGPRGLMPNPKTGTVTFDIAKAVADSKAGKIEFRADKFGVVHVPLGRVEFTQDQLMKNLATFYDAVLRAKPSAAKGTYVKSAYISSTQGPSIRLDAPRIPLEIREYLSA